MCCYGSFPYILRTCGLSSLAQCLWELPRGNGFFWANRKSDRESSGSPERSPGRRPRLEGKAMAQSQQDRLPRGGIPTAHLFPGEWFCGCWQGGEMLGRGGWHLSSQLREAIGTSGPLHVPTTCHPHCLPVPGLPRKKQEQSRALWPLGSQAELFLLMSHQWPSVRSMEPTPLPHL